MPALYNLFLDGALPANFAVIGVDQKSMSRDDFLTRLRGGVDLFSRRRADDAHWADFAGHLTDYLVDAFDNPALYQTLAARMTEIERGWSVNALRIYYQATPPVTVPVLATHLAQAQLAGDHQRARIVIEKPFGHDLASARQLNALLTGIFNEGQIYRIDHYLGKETVQNITAFRFANALFEPIWDRRYIDHVQITVAEQVGVEHRGAYYEGAGALRDMVQNHLIQLLSLVAIDPPVSFAADEMRNKQVDVLHAIHPIHLDEVAQSAVRGQYGPGWIEGERVPAYRDEPGVAATSATETYAAVKLFIDNWRWQGVPFYLRTGKRMMEHLSAIYIQFHPVPHQPYPQRALGNDRPNSLTIHVQPQEGIQIGFQAKRPGERLHLAPVSMRFNYCEAFHAFAPDAYETLLLDVMLGDMTLFKRADQVEASWAVMMPILEAWKQQTPYDFPNYQSGTWGPEAAEVLIARDGRSWVQPTPMAGDEACQR